MSAPLLQGVTFRVEATGVLASRLEAMAGALQGNVIRIAPEDRDLYHAAAVLAGNAPLALLARATWLLQQAGVDEQTAHQALARLLEGAAANARAKSPAEALTGPVVRGDDVAIAAHVGALAPYPDVRALYEQLIAEMEQLVRPAEPAAPHTLRVA